MSRHSHLECYHGSAGRGLRFGADVADPDETRRLPDACRTCPSGICDGVTVAQRLCRSPCRGRCTWSAGGAAMVCHPSARVTSRQARRNTTEQRAVRSKRHLTQRSCIDLLRGPIAPSRAPRPLFRLSMRCVSSLATKVRRSGATLPSPFAQPVRYDFLTTSQSSGLIGTCCHSLTLLRLAREAY